MKKITWKFTVFVAVLLVFAGCADGRLPVDYYLDVTPDAPRSVPAATTAVDFTVSSNVVWEVLVNGEPVHNGAPGDELAYRLTMPANESTTDAVVYNVVFRSGDLAYDKEISVVVTQLAEVEVPPSYLTVDPSTDQDVEADVTSFPFRVDANVSWICKVDGGQQASGTAGQDVTVTFPANENTAEPAMRTVVFESADPGYDMEITVVITQSAAAEVPQPYLRADPSTEQNVEAHITSFLFTVDANVSWICKVDGEQQASGSTGQEVTVTFPINENTTATATRAVVFESADPGFAHTVTVNIVQAAAVPASPSPGTVLFRETWGTEGTTGGVLLADYTKSGTTTYETADKAGIGYSSVGGATLFAKIYDTATVAGSGGYAEASGGSQLLIPSSARSETITVSGIKLYGAEAIAFSMAYRKPTASDVTISYKFSDGATGSFVAGGSTTGNNEWVEHAFSTVAVPPGAVTVELYISAAVASNIRADDIVIRAAAN